MKRYRNRELWPDDHGVHINAHGGGLLRHDGWIYWYGEHKIAGRAGNRAWVGVHVYRTRDYSRWEDRGIAFDIRGGEAGGLKPGECVIERPKVLFNAKTKKFVMFFHCETDGKYSDAKVGIALADHPEGPFALLKIERPSIGRWPENTPEELKDPKRIAFTRSQPPVSNGENPRTKELSIVGADLPVGQQSRDMTLFQDEDGRAYLIHSSEANSTLHIVELDETFTRLDGPCYRAFPLRWMEAPVVFRHGGRYYMICSGCTGWAPNAARSAVADRIEGPWTELGNPARGEGAETTFGTQGTFAWEEQGRIFFLADEWRPENAIDGRYVWLEVTWEGELPVLRDSENDPLPLDPLRA